MFSCHHLIIPRAVPPQFVLAVARRGDSLLDNSMTTNTRLEQIYTNVVLTLAAPLARRAGQTLLHIAAHEGVERVVVRVLKMLEECEICKELINKPDEDGRTPLFLAAVRGHITTVSILLSYKSADASCEGANPEVRANHSPALRALQGSASIKPERIEAKATPLQGWGGFGGVGFVRAAEKEYAFLAGLLTAKITPGDKGRWRYEVEIESRLVGMCSKLTVGWATEKWLSDVEANPDCVACVGDEPGSLGLRDDGKVYSEQTPIDIGGELHGRWWGNDTSVAKEGFGLLKQEWEAEAKWYPLSSYAWNNRKPQRAQALIPSQARRETLGVAIDMELQRCHFKCGDEGKWQSVDLPKSFSEAAVFPVVSGCVSAVKASFNFDARARPFKQEAPDDNGWQAIAKAGNGDGALLAAAAVGKMESVRVLRKELLERGKAQACMENDKSTGRSLLHWAAWWGQKSLVEELIEEKADHARGAAVLDDEDDGGKSAFFLALMQGHEEIAKLLDKRMSSAQFDVLAPLAMLYNTLRGDEWSVEARTKWLRINDASWWKGVTLEDNIVTALDLTKAGRHVDLELSAGWGRPFARLNKLRKLDLSGGRLRGHIPAEIGDLNELTDLNLSCNSLHGELPIKIIRRRQVLGYEVAKDGNAKKFSVALHGNEPGFTLPRNFDGLGDLAEIDLSDCSLRGKIPGELCTSFQGLQVLCLDSNRLSGQLPTELLCKIASGCEVHLRDNRPGFTMPNDLPEGFDVPVDGGTPAISELNLSNCSLRGALPLKLIQMKAAGCKVDLSGNESGFTLPSNIGDLGDIRNLDLSNCCLRRVRRMLCAHLSLAVSK